MSAAEFKIIGAEELKKSLEELGRSARETLPGVAARALASASIESFRDPALRPAPWPPLAPSTPGRAAGKTMLVDTGNMRAGIMAAGPSVNVSARAGKRQFPYPVVHQYGSRTVPARPFIPVLPDGRMSPRAEKRLAAAMEDALKAVARKVR